MTSSFAPVFRRAAVAALTLLVGTAVAGQGQEWRGPVAIEVVVEDNRGKDVPGAEVRLVYLAPSGGGVLPSVITDAGGKVAIGGLAAGRWMIEVRRDGLMTYRAEVALSADNRPSVLSAAQEMAPGATGTMRVKLNRAKGGAPLPVRETPAMAAPAPVARAAGAPPAQGLAEPRTAAPPAPAPTAKPATAPAAVAAPPTAQPASPAKPAAPVGPSASPSPVPTPAPAAKPTPPAPVTPAVSAPPPPPSAPIGPPTAAPAPAPTPKPAAPVTAPPSPPVSQTSPTAPVGPPTSAAPAPAPIPVAKPIAPAAAPAATPPSAAPSGTPRPAAAPTPAPAPVAPAAAAPANPAPAAAAAPPVTAAVAPPPPPVAPAPTAAPAPAAAATPSTAAPRQRLCVECAPGENAQWGEAIVEGGAGCPADLRQQFDAVSLYGDAGLAALNAALGPGCRAIRIDLPAGARFTGFRYEASGGAVTADCLPGRDCPSGGARFPFEPVIRREGGRTILLVGFESTAAETRAAVVAGYYSFTRK